MEWGKDWNGGRIGLEEGRVGGRNGLGVKGRVGEKGSEGRKGLRKERLEEGLEGGPEEGRTGRTTYWRKERWKKAGIKSLDQMHTYGMLPRGQCRRVFL